MLAFLTVFALGVGALLLAQEMNIEQTDVQPRQAKPVESFGGIKAAFLTGHVAR